MSGKECVSYKVMPVEDDEAPLDTTPAKGSSLVPGGLCLFHLANDGFMSCQMSHNGYPGLTKTFREGKSPWLHMQTIQNTFLGRRILIGG
jgi:hypothetical protein